MNNKYYVISADLLKQLLNDSNILNFLEINGVDNWEGFGIGFKDFIAEQLETTIEEVEEKEFDIEDVTEKDLEYYIKKGMLFPKGDE